MKAHSFRAQGPWFEGWYTRVTDTENNLSFAVITTSAIHSGQTLAKGDQPPGYVAVIISDGATSLSREDFPERTSIGNNGLDFIWTSPHGRVTSQNTQIAVGDASVEIQIEARTPWNAATPNRGPEGRLSVLPLPLHWYVENTNGLASYRVSFTDSSGKKMDRVGRGRVHQEKNWGGVFPRSWIWVQAADQEASIALAGGDLEVAGFTAHSYMLGYRSPKARVDFNIGQGLLTRFEDAIDACSRRFSLTAVNGEYKLVLRAIGRDFVSLAIPTEEGYKPGGAIEAFDAKIEVKLYRQGGLFVPDKLIETRIFSQGALEFGAEAMVCR